MANSWGNYSVTYSLFKFYQGSLAPIYVISLFIHVLLCNYTIVHVYCPLLGVLVIFRQKLEERIAMLNKVKFTVPKDREKWEVLTLELMSSEDSGMDEDEEILVCLSITPAFYSSRRNV